MKAFTKPDRMTRRILCMALISALLLALFPLTPVTLAMNDSLEEAGYLPVKTTDEDWSTLQEKLAGIKGIQTSYISAYTSGFTPGQLLGNGEIGVVSEPNANSHKFYLSHASLWNDRDNHANDRDLDQKMTFGGMTLSTTDERQLSFHVYSPESKGDTPTAVKANESYLYDGKFDNKWESLKPSSTNVYVPKTIYIDFGKEVTFDRWAIYHNSYKEDGDLGSAYSIYNNKDYTLERYIGEADDDKNDPDNYEVLDRIVGNTANKTDRSITSVTGQKFRIVISKPHETKNNQFAAVRELEFYNNNEKVFPFVSELPEFRHEQNIEKAQIDSRMDFASAKVSYQTWVSDSQNLMVTRLKSDSGSPAVNMEATLWAQPSPVKGTSVTGTAVQQTREFPSTSGIDGDMVYVTRQSTVYPTGTEEEKAYAESRYRSETAAATRIIGATATASALDDRNAKLSFTLQPDTEVYVITSLIGEGNVGQIPDLDALIAEAKQAAANTTKATIAEQYDEHLAWWKNFWLKSYVTLNDADLERYYYGSLYALASSYRSKHIAPGLYSVWNTSDVGQWGSRYTMNYNFQAPLYGVYAANRIELTETYFDTIAAADNLFKNNAALYGYGGRYGVRSLSARDVARDLPIELAAKASEKSPYDLPGGQAFTVSMASIHYVWMYEYTADQAYLRNEVYPRLKEMADFWMDYVVLDENPASPTYGKYQILYSSANESNYQRTDVNTTIDIGFMTYTLTKLIEYSHILDQDEDQVAVWQHYLDNLVPISTGEYAGYDTPLIQLAYKVDNPIKGNALINKKDQPISFEGLVAPSELYAIGSDPQMLRMIENTLNYMQAFDAAALSWGNAFSKTYPIAAKIGYPADQLIEYFKRPMLSGSSYGSFRATNLTQAGSGGGIESAGSIDTINSMLLQTNDGITRVFPNWSPTRDAEFVRLRGKGAFLFTASKDTKEGVKQVHVTSEAGQQLNLVIPWDYDALGASVYNADTGKAVKTTIKAAPYTEEAYVSFDTEAGSNYVLLRGEEHAPDDKEELKALMREAKQYDEALYTNESWNVLQDALAHAALVSEDVEASSEEIIHAVQALNSAIEGLVRRQQGTVSGEGETLAAGHITNLSEEGTLDWAHWHNIDKETRVPLFINKNAAQNLISNVEITGSTHDGFNGVGDLATLVEWSDGKPIDAWTDSSGKGTGVFIKSLNNGFTFTVPAITEERILKVYVGSWQADGKLTAQLDDGSEAYIGYSKKDEDNIAPNKSGKVFTIRYKAAEKGKTLTVSYIVDKNYDSAGKGNVVLQAATLGGAEEPADIAVESIDVKGQGGASAISTKEGTLQMIATVTPDDATNRTVTWAVYGEDGSVTDIAGISDSGLLTAMQNGTVKVVAAANDRSGVKGEASIVITGQDKTDPGEGTDPDDDSEPESGVNPDPNPNPGDSETEIIVEQGKATVRMRDDQTSVDIPWEKIAGHPLEVHAGLVTVAVDKQVQALIEKQIGDGTGAAIVVRIAPVQSDGTIVNNNVLKQTINGQAYDINVVLRTKEGIETNIGEIAGSGVLVTLPVEPKNADKDLLGVYHLNPLTNQWAFIGGAFNEKSDQAVFNLSQPGSYAVMEYDKTFTDVPSTHWAYRTIKQLSAKHMISGVSDDKFSPSGKTTRAEFTALLVRVLGLKASQPTVVFEDVGAEDWFAKEVAAAYEAGLVQGVTENEFAPDREITREQMALLLVRAYEYKNGTSKDAKDGLISYADRAKVSSWAESSVNKAIELGLMKGKSERLFNPISNTLRAEAAQAIINLMEKASL